MTTLDQATAIVLEAAARIALVSDRLPVRAALGRVLAADARATLDLPPFDKAAMDGYAISGPTPDGRYRVIEEVMAGGVPARAVAEGVAIKTMTGAPVPTGATQIVPVEYARREGDWVVIDRPTRESHICPRGEDVRCSDVVIRRGARIGPLELANLVHSGVAEVAVRRRVRIAVFSTGDEVVESPAQLAPGKILNANGPLLAALAARNGLEVIVERTLPDDRAEIAHAIAGAADDAELVVLSGGVSVGDRDYVTPALMDAGFAPQLHNVAIKPGRPLLFASRADVLAFGLPGNPVSVYLMYHLFVLRAVAAIEHSDWPCRIAQARLAAPFRRRKAERTEFVPCRTSSDGGVQAIDFHGSAHLAAMMQADGFFIVPAGTMELPAGADVDLFRL